jgi:selenocysteine-specific elongation factor
MFEAIERQLRTYLKRRRNHRWRVRDLMQISCKYAIPLLEHFDNQRLTMRIGDKRVLRKVG